MTDLALAQRYLPQFYADEAEPFPICRIGYTVLRQSGPSPSFARTIALPHGACMAIEYAIYFDYDIQHLYDLEHAWVYLNAGGDILDAEGSAHGAVFNMLRLCEEPRDGTHIPLYLQPGKHALLPSGRLAMLFPNYLAVCAQEAGKDGLLVAPLFEGQLHKTENTDAIVHRHIQACYRFTPSLRYIPAALPPDVLAPLPALLAEIPRRINRILQELQI